jgi:hypothetical protein
MKKMFLSLLLLTTATQAHAVSEAAALFLLIQPSVRANSMAGASVASAQHDALSGAFNPAHIGFAAFERSFNAEFYSHKTKWLPVFNLDDLNYNAKALVLGYDVRRLNKKIPVSIGFGYTRIFLNLGEQIIVDENSLEPIAIFNSSEHADIWSVGLAVDYYLKVGVGLNFKNIESNLAPIGIGADSLGGKATANAHDFGLLVQLPIIETFSKISKQPVKIGDNFEPFFTPTFGFSRSNIGDEISYPAAAQADPLPRVARMGLSVSAGIAYQRAAQRLPMFSFEWSSEAEDLLVRRSISGEVFYEGGLGEINFFDNVLKSNANAEVINRRGWELSLFDIFAYRSGRYDDPGGNVQYEASGFGVSFIGILRMLSIASPGLQNNRVLNFINNHLDVQFNHSSFESETSVLYNTYFNGVVIRLF